MFEALFGAGMPLAVRFFLAFLIVLGLIGGAAWAVRRFGAGRLGASSARGRQPRLAVIDYATVDTRRRLILVRRDNVEHLLMIGGPSDVVVESNIVRAAGVGTRDVPVARAPIPEALPRAMPLPEHSAWPLQPEPAAPPPPRAPRLEPLPEDAEFAPFAHHPEPPPRPPRETLALLAEEIAARPVPPRGRAPARAQAMEPRLEPRAEPRLPHAEAEDTDADQRLAEMAHSLEAALRKPKPAAEGRTPLARPAAPPPEPAMEEFEEALPPPPPPPAPRMPRGAEARPPRAEAKAHEPPRSFEPRPPAEPKAAEPRHVDVKPAEARMSEARLPDARAAEPRTTEAKTGEPKQADGRSGQGKGLYDSLEQEMASLLGRPAGKT
jgi:hypothetical protein